MNSKLLKQPHPKWLMVVFKSIEGSPIEILDYSRSLVLVNNFISVLHEGIIGMLIEWTRDTSLEGIEIRYKIADRIEVQNYFDTLRCWAKTNNMKCNKDKCKVLFWGPKMNYRNTGWRTCNLAAADVKRPWGSYLSKSSIWADSVIWLRSPHCTDGSIVWPSRDTLGSAPHPRWNQGYYFKFRVCWNSDRPETTWRRRWGWGIPASPDSASIAYCGWPF